MQFEVTDFSLLSSNTQFSPSSTRSQDWIGGPGKIEPTATPFDPSKFAFVDEFETFRVFVSGEDNLGKFARKTTNNGLVVVVVVDG